MKFLLAVMYGSPQRCSNSSKTFKKIEIDFSKEWSHLLNHLKKLTSLAQPDKMTLFESMYLKTETRMTAQNVFFNHRKIDNRNK